MRILAATVPLDGGLVLRFLTGGGAAVDVVGTAIELSSIPSAEPGVVKR